MKFTVKLISQIIKTFQGFQKNCISIIMVFKSVVLTLVLTDSKFTIEALFEVARESWREWDLNPRPLNSVPTL